MLGRILLLSACAVLLISGCGRPTDASFPRSQGIPLLGQPVHLGNNVATGQNWVHGEASAAMHCSLVNLPRASDGFVQVLGVRDTETLADSLTVNEQRFPLPITLEQGQFGGVTPSATQHSPLFRVRLPAGPSQVCLVAGQRNNGDVDDFEADEVLLFADGIERDEVAIRKGLTQGTPAPSVPNASPWGQRQQWPVPPPSRGWGCASASRPQWGC